MIIYFNTKTGKIEKEGTGILKGSKISVTVDDAREAWRNCEIVDCNIAFHRLANEYNFDVKKLMEFYNCNSNHKPCDVRRKSTDNACQHYPCE